MSEQLYWQLCEQLRNKLRERLDGQLYEQLCEQLRNKLREGEV